MPRDAPAIVLLVARLSIREAVRGRAAAGLAGVTAALLALFALAASQAMDAARDASGTLTVDVVGATLLGTAAFCGLLLGAIVAVFLTHSAVRGDAERGLLQPLLVRPVSRGAVVAGRGLAGAVVAAAYTATLWAAAVGIVRVAGGWSPPHALGPGLALAAAVALVALTTVAASTLLGAMGAGIAALTLVALGLAVGLLAQLGATLGLATLGRVADVVALVLPFEALYRHVLFSLTDGLGDLARVGVAVGPFGGAHAAGGWQLAVIAIWAIAVSAFVVGRARRLDL